MISPLIVLNSRLTVLYQGITLRGSEGDNHFFFVDVKLRNKYDSTPFNVLG